MGRAEQGDDGTTMTELRYLAPNSLDEAIKAFTGSFYFMPPIAWHGKYPSSDIMFGEWIIDYIKHEQLALKATRQLDGGLEGMSG